MLARFAILRLQLVLEGEPGPQRRVRRSLQLCKAGTAVALQQKTAARDCAASLLRKIAASQSQKVKLQGSDVAHAVTDSAERAPGGRTHVSPQSRTRLESKKLMFDH